MKKILIIEDVDVNLDLLMQLLEDDYELITAGDGNSGVEATIREIPDLILMDMSLPIMGGWEATKKIKSIENLKDIPVIGLSAHAMAGDREKAIEAGCDEYLTKPINEDILFNKLELFLK